jgi:indolepyruvate ferredoxin oxidoreductase
MKFLRGTAFDFMAWFSSDIRQADKKVLNFYRDTISSKIDGIGNGQYENLIKFSKLPDIIRGYEEVRLETMDEYFKKAQSVF